ncbi:MAG: acyl-CoA dehydratase activase-related protein [Rikenellaceae bacterium]|nr:acyl-CoA dehydratase activase-related protein [Rikenellaceae bacterium]
MNATKIYRIGLDIGSTTAKGVMVDPQNRIVFHRYERHHAAVPEVLARFFEDILTEFGDVPVSVTVTGSVGMGMAERFDVPFVQEVVAATKYVRTLHPGISTIIDIGGEDAKIVYIKSNGSADLRMNGNCAGGTGAFIDQMAHLLAVPVEELDGLARAAERTYPIASRCGVFSKTDMQNLVSKNVSKADIAASIFRAVAVQTVVTLSHGCAIEPKILFCGGPLSFIPSLRQAFVDYIGIQPNQYMIPEKANLIPAWGCALCCEPEKNIRLGKLIERLSDTTVRGGLKQTERLAPIFRNPEEYAAWQRRISGNPIESADLSAHTGYAYLGIDSGSTTTKIVVTDEQQRILFKHYAPNRGNPIQTVKEGLAMLQEQCELRGIDLKINGSFSTGYGEDLIKAAFSLEGGIIETIAHYVAARKIDPEVSFILDIGGQDMKAIFVENGVLSRMEINEACSSGCGSFIETFAQSLNYPVRQFAQTACTAQAPCDLGTRCTVFMNSKVKQVLREGATVADMAAGISYSVVKNCLYKVLKLRRTEELGRQIVVQGGTMRNDSVVRAFELLTGVQVSRSNLPELMGAYGCALYAQSEGDLRAPLSLKEVLQTAEYTTRQIQCRGCENQCFVHKYSFANHNTYYSGNKCEKVFSNQGTRRIRGRNLSVEKNSYLFDRISSAEGRITLGIPRCLNMYENYPFWHALFNACGIRTVLSDKSTFANYEAGVHSVMSDNICFPAKLVHSHVYNLIDKKVDRIFFPYVVFEKPEGRRTANSYNCPIVSGYSEVIKSAIDPAIPVDSPVINFKEEKALLNGCAAYLQSLGIPKTTEKKAVRIALEAQEKFERQLRETNRKAYQDSKTEGKMTIVLAGRPYHTDPLIQHKLSDMISDMGVTVLTEDIVRNDESISISQSHLVSQWSYINRILRAAQWVAEQGHEVHFVQMTSFGCGPDAFLLDEVKSILNRYGKSLTLLKIDDVNNIGSIKLRVRSVVESLKFSHNQHRRQADPFLTTKVYRPADRKRTILAPFFTDYISPLIPPLLKLAGYNCVSLPESDSQSIEYGLQYANNEVCYPATLVVGDVIRALKSGRYDPDRVAVAMSQTGGQCRASNYIALLKKGIAEAGYPQVPVISLAMGEGLVNEQYGFKINWLKVIPVTLAAILYSDCISKFFHASVVREHEKGAARRLREYYLEAVQPLIRKNDPGAVYRMIGTAAQDFDRIIHDAGPLPKVGIVGEIYLKFNSFAHKRIADWLINQGIEVISPTLCSFFFQSFVNSKVRKRAFLEKKGTPEFIMDWVYTLLMKRVAKVNRLASRFRYFVPFTDVFQEAEHGKEVITLAAQFGEGWLLPAEIVSFAKAGVNNVISLQPFGCIANHIISKGVEKRIKTLYPQMNLLSLDFDSGVSDVNVVNRLHLITHNLK